jgi:hypothetical protein
MHGLINVKSPNNISKWQMGFNSAFKGLIHQRKKISLFQIACSYYASRPFRIMWIKLFLRHSEILHEIRKRKANWIGHILRRNCLLQRVIEGKIQGEIEVAGRQGRRRRKLLDDLKERRGYSHLKEKTLDCGELALEEALDLS